MELGLYLFGGFMLVLGVLLLTLQRQIREYDPNEQRRASPDPPRRPRPDPVVTRLLLTQSSRDAILRHYYRLYPIDLKSPDIKLEAFFEMIENSGPLETIPIYFAQLRVVRKFADEANLPWLADQLRDPQPASEVIA